MSGNRPSHIAQIAVPVRNLDRAKAFYAGKLGLDHLFDAPPGLSFFRCGETRLMLSRVEEPEAVRGPFLCYGVANAGEAMAALAKMGVPAEEEARCIARVEGRDVWLGFVRDSEGNPVGLMSEHPAG